MTKNEFKLNYILNKTELKWDQILTKSELKLDAFHQDNPGVNLDQISTKPGLKSRLEMTTLDS